MENIVDLDSVDKYNKMYGLPTLHPLVSVVDLTRATNVVNHVQMHYGLYALFLKGGVQCELKYGRRNYDYGDGTIVAFAPGQVVGVDMDVDEVQPKVYGLLFHPDIIAGTSLGKSIKKHGFFSYSSNEALHLSIAERQVILDCLAGIERELERSVDNHSKPIIATNIELLLNYCLRFYERQFITRQVANQDVLIKFENALNDYFAADAPDKGLPTVTYFADKVHLSANYFGDLIKKESGKSPQDYIATWLVNLAKERILSTNLTISEIAYQLGFGYPQHFNRFFKRNVGVTPSTYRVSS